MNTAELLDALAHRFDLHSDYAIAKHLGISRQRVSKYRHGEATIGDELALIVAEALQLDAGYVLASLAAERAKGTPTAKAWEALAKKAGAAVLCLMLLPFCPTLTGSSAPAKSAPPAARWISQLTHYAPRRFQNALERIAALWTAPNP